jgi:arabinofuranosyltransferase
VLSLLLGLTRPEGNLVAGVTLVTTFFSVPPEARGTLARATIGTYVVPGAAYFVWRFAYYGHLFPLPFYLKVTAQVGPKGVRDVAAYLIQFGSRVLPFVVAGLVASPTPWARPAWPAWAAVVAFLGFFLFPEHIMGNNDRYSFPSAAVLCGFTAPGTAALLAWARAAGQRGLALAAAALAFSVVALVHDARSPIHSARAYARGLEAAHVRLGKRLAMLPAGTLAIGDAGAVPYLSGWSTVDTFGLNDPHIATTGSHDPAYVLARRPDVIVLISSRLDAFDPHLEWERVLYDAALGAGFAVAARLACNESYFLWVLAKPGTEAAHTVASLAAR